MRPDVELGFRVHDLGTLDASPSQASEETGKSYGGRCAYRFAAFPLSWFSTNPDAQ
jgi:hypothetical protein